MLYPMVALATVAAIIASQALISGAFSLTQQAMQLGYSPRLKVVHTSKHEAGQIYIREVNIALAVGCLALVVGFRSSLESRRRVRHRGHRHDGDHDHALHRGRAAAARLAALARAFLPRLLPHDRPGFLAANVVKIAHGGWFPLAVAAGVYMHAHHVEARPRRGAADRCAKRACRSTSSSRACGSGSRCRVRGTAVFMTSDTQGAPVVLLHHLKHNKVLHEQVILLSVITAGTPEVPVQERTAVTAARRRILPRDRALRLHADAERARGARPAARPPASRMRPGDTSYFLGREQLIPTGSSQDAALAQEALRDHVAQRARRHGILRSAAQSRRRARRADRVLMRRGAALAALSMIVAAAGRRAGIHRSAQRAARAPHRGHARVHRVARIFGGGVRIGTRPTRRHTRPSRRPPRTRWGSRIARRSKRRSRGPARPAASTAQGFSDLVLAFKWRVDGFTAAIRRLRDPAGDQASSRRRSVQLG